MSPYRKPAPSPVDFKVEMTLVEGPPQFRDERCAACGHDRQLHSPYGSGCFSCEAKRRCQAFVWKPGQKP